MADARTMTSDRVYWSLAVMAVCFSLNHGCVTTVLGLASSELGKYLGGFSSGTLYVCYTLIALVGATAIVDMMGATRALVAGTGAYCFYVATFIVAFLVPAVKWPVCIVGSVIGGCAAGWLWTAQGAYFSECARLHAEAVLQEAAREDAQALLAHTPGAEEDLHATRLAAQKGESTAVLASLFSTIYLGCELVLGVAGWALLRLGGGGKLVCFIMFTSVAVASALGMAALVPDMTPPRDPAAPKKHPLAKAGEAVQLLGSDPKMPLMYPLQMSFGFSAAFMLYYVTKDVIKEYLKVEYIPLLRAVVSGVAAAGSIPTAKLAGVLGKPPVVLAGLACYLAFAVVFEALPAEATGKWAVIVPMFVVFGCGRCVWEGMNKAVMADFFPTQGAAWGANVIVASGGATALGFFVFPLLDKTEMAIICMVTTCAAIVCYLIANSIHITQTKPSLSSQI